MASMSYGPGEAYNGSPYDRPSLLSPPSHPMGLCVTLTEREMEMLNLEHPSDIGDTIHLNVMAKVKRITKSDESCTVECQITDMMVAENETDESGKDAEEGE